MREWKIDQSIHMSRMYIIEGAKRNICASSVWRKTNCSWEKSSKRIISWNPKRYLAVTNDLCQKLLLYTEDFAKWMKNCRDKQYLREAAWYPGKVGFHSVPLFNTYSWFLHRTKSANISTRIRLTTSHDKAQLLDLSEFENSASILMQQSINLSTITGIFICGQCHVCTN